MKLSRASTPLDLRAVTGQQSSGPTSQSKTLFVQEFILRMGKINEIPDMNLISHKLEQILGKHIYDLDFREIISA